VPVKQLKLLSQSSVLVGYTGILADGKYVYISGARSLYRIPSSGGPVEALYSGPANLGEVRAASGTVAWVVLSSDASPASVAVANADGLHVVALPAEVLPLPSPAAPALVDEDGNVYLEATLATDEMPHTWRWSPMTKVAEEMPGVGRPDAGGRTELLLVDRGQIFWVNNVEGPDAGIYVTDIGTGTSKQISTGGLGSLAGVDAKNLYGVSSVCPAGACPFTVFGIPRDGSGPLFEAFKTADAYRTASPPQADDSGIYWMDWLLPGIFHATMGPDTPADLVVQIGRVDGGQVPAYFAMDACNLYWISSGAQRAPTLMAIAK